MAGEEPILTVRGLGKVYPNGVEANKDINLDLYPGRVYALLGENGAGKTTLVKILVGAEKPTRGNILLKGAPLRLKTPRDAYRLGVYMVPQHPMLFDNLRVYEDVGLTLRQAGYKLGRSEVKTLIQEAASRYGIAVNPDARIASLSVGEKQKVEVLKGVLVGRTMLFLDEPSTHMTSLEAEALASIARRLAGEGRVIVYITHRIDEALKAADTILVMRRGRLVATIQARRASKGKVLEAMFGRPIESMARPPERRLDRAILRIEDLWVKARHGGWALKGVSLELRRGEILGVAGIAGNGQRELLEAIAGLTRPSRGRILFDAVNVTGLSPLERLKRGLAVVPEERLGWAVIPGKSIEFNASIPLEARNGGGILINKKRIRGIAEAVVSLTGVRLPSLDSPVEVLSGGNMQRLILGRELMAEPKVIVAMNPTAGLDVEAGEKVKTMLVDASSRGTGVLLIDEDLDLLTSISDRIIVLSRGRVTGSYKAPFNRTDIARAMSLRAEGAVSAPR